MNERRKLFGITRDAIPSSAVEITKNTYSNFSGYNVLYVPIITGFEYDNIPRYYIVIRPTDAAGNKYCRLWINDVEYRYCFVETETNNGHVDTSSYLIRGYNPSINIECNYSFYNTIYSPQLCEYQLCVHSTGDNTASIPVCPTRFFPQTEEDGYITSGSGVVSVTGEETIYAKIKVSFSTGDCRIASWSETYLNGNYHFYVDKETT